MKRANSQTGARFVALEWMCEQARHRVHETPPNSNRGPLIDEINRNAGAPLGSPYCASAVKYAFKQAGVTDFGGPHGASVGYMDEWAAQRGYRVTRPLSGDAFAWKLDGDNWPDHAGMVLKVRSWGGLLFTIDTVEANTSASSAGSQDNGGGFYFRRRTFRRGRVDFVRDPRPVVEPPQKKKPVTRPKQVKGKPRVKKPAPPVKAAPKKRAPRKPAGGDAK